VAHSSLLAGTYSLDDRWSAEQPLGKRASDYRPDAPAYLIMTVLLSLGIWAAILVGGHVIVLGFVVTV
jgi:hypothetical protein